jgi:hypothetical protein
MNNIDIQFFFFRTYNKSFFCKIHFISFGKFKAAIFANMQAKDDLQTRWWALETKLVERFGKKPDMETILFLIGVQEFGQVKEKFTKEQKQDLMHIAICSLFAQSGYYEMEGRDIDGWPHFRQLKSLPPLSAIEQENFMKDHILLYFETHNF